MADVKSRANIVAIVKTKMQLVLGKNTLEMNEFTENECLPNLELKFKILENLRKPLTLKIRENALTLALKVFPLLAHGRG